MCINKSGDCKYIKTSGKREKTRCFDEDQNCHSKHRVFGRQLITNSKKTQAIMYREGRIDLLELSKINENYPCSKYTDKKYLKIIDMVMTKNDRTIFFLNYKGMIFLIDTVRYAKGECYNLRESQAESHNSEETKGNEKNHKFKFSILRISEDDKYLAAISTEPSNREHAGTASEPSSSSKDLCSFILTVHVMVISQSSQDNKMPSIARTEKKDIEIEKLPADIGSSGLIAQYANFSLKKSSTYYLIAFLRIPLKMLIISIVDGRIESTPEQIDLPNPFPDTKTFLNDGVRVENNLYVTLHSSSFLRITLDV